MYFPLTLSIEIVGKYLEDLKMGENSNSNLLQTYCLIISHSLKFPLPKAR